MPKTRIVTVVPVCVADIRTGDRVRCTYHEPTADVTGAKKGFANGVEVYVVDLHIGDDIFETYVGIDHTFWLVIDEQIVEAE